MYPSNSVEILSTEKMIVNFSNDLRQNKYKDSIDVAQSTLSLLKRILVHQEECSAQDLMTLFKTVGRSFNAVSTSANVVRRVLKIVREEYVALYHQRHEQPQEGQSLHKMMMTADSTAAASSSSSVSSPATTTTSKTKSSSSSSSFSSSSSQHKDNDEYWSHLVPELKTRVLESMEELHSELETSTEEISNQVLEHIHANEVILTLGKSETVERFLMQGFKDRKFHVIVAECSPSHSGRDLAVSLAKAGVSTTLITDSAIFAMMARVNKVIIGTHSVWADGGLEAVTGSYTVALAAKHYSIPLIVCSPIYKLTPVYRHTGNSSVDKFASPEETLKGLGGGKILSKVRSCNPVYEYVPPELVTLFISNVSSHAPSYVYRLLNEFYHPDDNEL